MTDTDRRSEVRSRRANTHTARATESYESRADIVPGIAGARNVRQGSWTAGVNTERND